MFRYNLTRIPGILQEHQYTFFIISRSFFLIMRNFSDMFVEKIKTYFVLSNYTGLSKKDGRDLKPL
jgi:hypothetical protein